MAGIGKNFLFVVRDQTAVLHEKLAVDHHGPHITRFGTVNNLAEHIVHRLAVDRIEIDQDQVRAFAYLDSAADRIEPERFGAAGRRHAQNRIRIDDPGVLMMDLLKSDAAFMVSNRSCE